MTSKQPTLHNSIIIIITYTYNSLLKNIYVFDYFLAIYIHTIILFFLVFEFHNSLLDWYLQKNSHD